jgi:hypothetical protein
MNLVIPLLIACIILTLTGGCLLANRLAISAGTNAALAACLRDVGGMLLGAVFFYVLLKLT